jgi:hypothetical protein
MIVEHPLSLSQESSIPFHNELRSDGSHLRFRWDPEDVSDRRMDSRSKELIAAQFSDLSARIVSIQRSISRGNV